MLYNFNATIQNLYLAVLIAGLDFLLHWAFYVSILTGAYQYHILKI
jgi:hypothetical protein